jgi:hypothetical protein
VHDLRDRLDPHRGSPAVQDFFEETAVLMAALG